MASNTLGLYSSACRTITTTALPTAIVARVESPEWHRTRKTHHFGASDRSMHAVVVAFSTLVHMLPDVVLAVSWFPGPMQSVTFSQDGVSVLAVTVGSMPIDRVSSASCHTSSGAFAIEYPAVRLRSSGTHCCMHSPRHSARVLATSSVHVPRALDKNTVLAFGWLVVGSTWDGNSQNAPARTYRADSPVPARTVSCGELAAVFLGSGGGALSTGNSTDMLMFPCTWRQLTRVPMRAPDTDIVLASDACSRRGIATSDTTTNSVHSAGGNSHSNMPRRHASFMLTACLCVCSISVFVRAVYLPLLGALLLLGGV